MSDTSTAMFRSVDLQAKPDGYIEVIGRWGSEHSMYAVPTGRLRVGALFAFLPGDSQVTLKPEQGYLWVESTGDELRITEEEP